ncbi:hypothetical protein KR084_006859 [Drosophila pseudotakahashii]|nr:hypothetical protein KR084_006859 [Drosophila pseudotakahashii]
MHVIEQERGTLRQGSLTQLQYYDEVEKKLTLLTNKVNMFYEQNMAKILCEKFRDDALRVFISGLKRSLTNLLINAIKSGQIPHSASALALAQEVESNHERYQFATTFARNQEERDQKSSLKTQRQDSHADGTTD